MVLMNNLVTVCSFSIMYLCLKNRGQIHWKDIVQLSSSNNHTLAITIILSLGCPDMCGQYLFVCRKSISVAKHIKCLDTFTPF